MQIINKHSLTVVEVTARERREEYSGENWIELQSYIAALRAERDELLTLVLRLAEKAPCARCVNGKDENGDACEFCGGYGFHPAGDIREHMIDARAALAKYEVTK